MDKKTVLFLGKKNDWHTQRALRFIRMHFDVTDHLGDWGDQAPWAMYAITWKYDYLISYLSRWVVPKEYLEKTRIANINFHPASPHYPGIGCINFALYNGTPVYGCTCHHMEPEVDTGKIIANRWILIHPNDTVESLLNRTYDEQLSLFYWVLDAIIRTGRIPEKNITWRREPYTRKEFNELCVIRPEMDADEIKRRIRAVTYKQYSPKIEIDGALFRLEGG